MPVCVKRSTSRTVKKSLTVVKEKLTTDESITLLPNCREWAFDFTANKIIDRYGDRYPLKIEYLNENKGKRYGRSIVFWHKQSAVVDKKNSAVCVTEGFSWDDKTVDQWANEYSCICPRNKKWARRIRQNRTVIANKTPVIEIQPGVDIALFNPGSRIANTEGRLCVGWAGRPDFGKNIATDYKGYALIKKVEEQMPHVDFKYASSIPHEKMPEFYRSIDVLLIASIDEGVPFPLLEGMACGCRVIATNVGVAPEVIMDGARVDTIVRSEKSIIDAIDRVDQNRELLINALSINPDVIASKWNWSDKVEQWEDALKCIYPIESTIQREDIGEGFLIKNKLEIEKLSTESVATDKFHIMIPTYNRPKELLNLLKSIEKEKSLFEISVSIYNDGSDVNYGAVEKWIDKRDWIKYTKSNKNNGKCGYWKTVSHLIMETQAMKDRYFVYLSDDCEICKSFFYVIKNRYDSLPDNKIALNLHIDKKREKAEWFNGKEPLEINTPTGKAYDIGWIDGAFICTRKLFDVIGYTRNAIYPEYWSDNPHSIGSMVWSVHWEINHKVHKIYRTENSYIKLVKTDSVMHPDAGDRDLYTINFYDNKTNKYKYIGHVCSYSSRYPLLYATFKTIIDQVDILFVYLNDINSIAEYLKHPKVFLMLGQNTAGDLKSVGKFYKADVLDGYHFHFDDDLFYPDNYVDIMVDRINHYKKKALLCVHGNILDGKIESYYKNKKTIKCLNGLDSDTVVDVPGTATIAYHTDTLRLNNNIHNHQNMDDIQMGIWCRQNNIPIIAISRINGWIKYNGGVNEDKTIWAQNHNSDEKQTDMALRIIEMKKEAQNADSQTG